MNKIDQLLHQRTQLLIQTLTKQYAHIDLAMLKALPKEKDQTLYEELHAFESMLEMCKKRLFSLDKSSILDKLRGEYAYKDSDHTTSLTLQHIESFLQSFTNTTHQEVVINAQTVQGYQEDKELIRAAINAVTLRIRQIQANHLTAWFKVNKMISHEYEDFQKTLEDFLTTIHNCQHIMHKNLADHIIKNFCHIYSYFASLIYFHQDEGDTFLLLEISAKIETIKHLLQAPQSKRTLSLQELRNNYAFVELSLLQEIILKRI